MKIAVEFVEWKDWNTYLTNTLGNNNKVRYFQADYIELQIPKYLNKDVSSIKVDDAFKDVKKLWYSFKIEECTIYYDGYHKLLHFYPDLLGKNTEKRKGYKISIRVTHQNALDEPNSTNEGEATLQLCKKLTNLYELNKHRFSPKFSTMSKKRVEEIVNNSKYKDKYGIEIELGDMVAHPSGSIGGGSWVEISKVTEFGLNRINGWIPERLIIVRAKNPSKKLGW